MALKDKRQRTRLLDLDMGAFADIAFLLIIFFILTTAVATTQGTVMEIPAGQKSKEPTKEKQLSIHLTRQRILWGEKGAELTVDALRTRLRNLDLPSRDEEDRVVILESKKDVPFETYFRVVTSINEAGGILAILETEEGDE
ncbi:MAG: ExbD/TolR family protein [Planctomycetota bacterium]